MTTKNPKQKTYKRCPVKSIFRNILLNFSSIYGGVSKTFAMKPAEVVGQNIADRRKLLGLSQKELAIRLDITQDALNRMEKGRIAPKIGRLEDIASHLECTVPFLFRRESEALQERAATIADILATLPEAGQEALVSLVADTARVMNIRGH